MVSPIKPADWQNILKLLMLTMLADGRAYERQADTFVDASFVLRSNMKVRGVQTRKMTMDWYIRNRQELVDIQTGETFEQDLLAIIDSLESIPDKKPLIRALKNMAKRDDEAGILSKSRERWA